MGFEALLGNRRIKENLQLSLAKGHASHFYLISGPAGSGKHTLARLLSAALMCESNQRPCGTCSACRKVLSGIHPDCITITDPEHKTVPVKLVRQVRDDMFIRPNEGIRKIYIFPQELGVEGQNALLKILEEPPSYGAYLLLTEKAEQLLPTVRSRCVHLALQPLPDDILRWELQQRFPEAKEASIGAAISRSGGFLGQAAQLLSEDTALLPQTEAFFRAYAQRDELLLLQTLAPMEKWKREQLLEALRQWLPVLIEALACRSGMSALSPAAAEIAGIRSSRELNDAIECLQNALQYAQMNVSVGAICGWLQWQLR